jgi:hypothetical protein
VIHSERPLDGVVRRAPFLCSVGLQHFGSRSPLATALRCRPGWYGLDCRRPRLSGGHAVQEHPQRTGLPPRWSSPPTVVTLHGQEGRVEVAPSTLNHSSSPRGCRSCEDSTAATWIATTQPRVPSESSRVYRRLRSVSATTFPVSSFLSGTTRQRMSRRVSAEPIRR